MEPKNLKEAKELIQTYRSITVPMIRKVIEEGKHALEVNEVANRLTGFGGLASCTLCSKGGADYYPACSFCIYEGDGACFRGENRSTYVSIEYAKAPMELKKAFKARAKHIKQVIKKWE